VVQQALGQLRLGGEQYLLRNPGQLPVLLITGAPLGQVQRPAEKLLDLTIDRLIATGYLTSPAGTAELPLAGYRIAKQDCP
jgi:hypothetical protein